jgi:hypothetical protein
VSVWVQPRSPTPRQLGRSDSLPCNTPFW